MLSPSCAIQRPPGRSRSFDGPHEAGRVPVTPQFDPEFSYVVRPSEDSDRPGGTPAFMSIRSIPSRHGQIRAPGRFSIKIAQAAESIRPPGDNL